MKILNLVYPEKSDIKYNKIQFPDGQQSIVLDMKIKTDKAVIKTRLNDFKDVELLICATQALYNTNSVKEIALYCPYFLGSRSDRKFEYGSVNYLKDVICPIINNLKFFEVSVLDPHSDVLEACIKGFRKESNLELVKFGLNNIYNLRCGETGYLKQNSFILVSPDAGASKKIYKLAEQIGYKGDIITCSKERDTEGKLSKTVFPFETHKYNGEDFIIIDDICDGGQTFINIARKIKDCFAIRSANQNIKPGKIYLIVTHSIFSKGFGELSQYFDGIYCTNSYSDIEPPINFTERHHYIKEKVKQLNIF